MSPPGGHHFGGVLRTDAPPRILAVSDEVEEALWTDRVTDLSVDLILAAGDLPFDYLDFLASALDRPLVFVPGNHDPDLSGFGFRNGLPLRAGFPARWPGPPGGVNADGRVVEIAGVRVAGLGGSPCYNGGPNQWTESEQSRRARRLVRRARGEPVDVLLTHTPPRGVGDGTDPPHQGFDCLRHTVRRLRPRWLLHGHVHPYGKRPPDHHLDGTRVRNIVGAHVFHIGSRAGTEAL
ncbi:metallophosphoesterase family protein [Saccharomonospora cyanea]|uniref:Putative phosphoesterase, ICC n=1 Tax=Saccharomonospora cyanea NA-134 TaxID=882082 RepID=H5XJE1_9PSEU|nr:metallophosphoesterase [Saccharomonospora cyanea]EHR59691.1 putative phosphoesterase, ICC [Saccharomonospora cyanea NA-134]